MYNSSSRFDGAWISCAHRFRYESARRSCLISPMKKPCCSAQILKSGVNSIEGAQPVVDQEEEPVSTANNGGATEADGKRDPSSPPMSMSQWPTTAIAPAVLHCWLLPYRRNHLLPRGSPYQQRQDSHLINFLYFFVLVSCCSSSRLK